MAYASYNDGLSLTTFYARSEAFEPTVLVVKTTCQEVFGAYCSTSWSQRGLKDEKGQRQIYFGGGETFLFSFSQSCLDSPGEEVKIYPWVLGPSAVSKIDQAQLTKVRPIHASAAWLIIYQLRNVDYILFEFLSTFLEFFNF